MNPYDPNLSRSTAGSRTKNWFGAKPLVYRLTLVVSWLIGSIASAVAFFFAVNAADPCMPIDFPYYRNLYAGIGLTSGVLALFVGHLVVANRVSPRTVILLLSLPYFFVLLVALDQGPPVALLATIVFGSAVVFAYWIRPLSAIPLAECEFKPETQFLEASEKLFSDPT